MPDTPILGLRQYGPLEDFDYTEVNAGNSKIDTLPPTVCTSATRPIIDLYTSRLIWETDTKRLMMWDGDSWERAHEGNLLPAPVRGYYINTNKSVTATAWADVASDSAKSITLPKAAMCVITTRAILNGVAGTGLTARVAWTGATTGNTYDQMDTAVLGAMSSFEASKRDIYSFTALFNAGVTNFKLQAQRSNTTNATSVDAASISITPVAWGDAYVGGAT